MADQPESPIGTPENSPADKRVRRVNAWIAAGISALFFAHALLGCAVLGIPGFPSRLEWIVWVGVFAIVVHITLSIATTYFMLTDDVRPPSKRKKNHQLLKWITGGLLIASVVGHIVLGKMAGAGNAMAFTLVYVALGVTAILLCVHVFNGVKSLTRDLNLPSKLRLPIRIVAIALCVLICVFVILLCLPH